jgi:hypothetical protein
MWVSRKIVSVVIMLVISVSVWSSCGQKMDIPTKGSDKGIPGDTFYVRVASWYPGDGDPDHEFLKPIAVVNGTGLIYVMDAEAGRVIKFDSGGRRFLGYVKEGLDSPSAMAYRASRLYIAVGRRVSWYTTSSPPESLGAFEDTVLMSIAGLAARGDYVFVADSADSKIWKYDLSGNPDPADSGRAVGADSIMAYAYLVSRRGEGLGYVSDPHGLAITSDGNLLVADAGHGWVQLLDPDEANAPIFFGAEPALGFYSDTLLVRPVDVSVDAQDNIYVVDSFFVPDSTDPWDCGYQSTCRVTKFNTFGELTQMFGLPGSGAGEFCKPRSLAAYDEAYVGMYLFIADTGNNRIEKYQSSASIIPTKR